MLKKNRKFAYLKEEEEDEDEEVEEEFLIEER